jgi:hypothetical protein
MSTYDDALRIELGARHRKARAKGDTGEADANARPRRQFQPRNLVIGYVNAAGKMSMSLLEAAVTRANKAETWQGTGETDALFIFIAGIVKLPLDLLCR